MLQYLLIHVTYSTPGLLASQAFLISLLIKIYWYRDKTCCNVLDNELYLNNDTVFVSLGTVCTPVGVSASTDYSSIHECFTFTLLIW